MKKELFSIGEVAKLFHISVSSLRHYESRGLLKPAYIAPTSGYRYYGLEQFEVLNTIRYLRALDMPLSAITEFLQNREVEHIEEKLQQHKAAVMKKQQELQRVAQKIEHRLQWLRDAQTSVLDTISVLKLPACRVAWVENPLKIEGFFDMETPIRSLDRSDAEAVVFLGKVGLGISAEHLHQGNTAHYDGSFLVLDQEDIYTGRTILLPETLCVRIRFRGCHPEAQAYYNKLLSYVQEHHMHIAGFSREITLIDYGITNNPEKFVTEISIPVCQE